ncbi:alpha/beta fold hydrolase [Limnoglobus roseus]|uniref:Alpha/beta hydrolase n=1 Tax=Limnoglobus roseus TaxID=2598579 RepID=A0A5C1ABN1_9BACT|nr:alpha/beta hydrolase [Limnoglobus roseus]QEL15436.1 alpha/beta hydrolase [Limnoglobus roseus]
MLTVTPDELRTAVRRFEQEAAWHVLPTPRYRMRYLTWGDGPRILVIVHGLNDQPRSFAMVMGHLVGDFRCVALDLPHGRGDGATLGAYRHADYARDLLALLDHLKLDQVDLLGSSFGSTISLRTAAEFPARIRRLVLQGGFARRPLLRWQRGLARLGRYWPWQMEQLIGRVTVMKHFEAPAFVSAPPDIFDFLMENSGPSPCRAVARRVLELNKLDLRPLLPRVRVPVLMLGGDRDTIVPREFEAEVERGLSDVRRVEFTPCGHYPQYTHPSAMAAEVRRFLAQ